MAILVLSPYATLDLGFDAALIRQAVVTLVATGALLLWGLHRRASWRRLLEIPSPVRLGLVSWSAAAVLGTVVALVVGNPPARAAGQLLSMGLLPLGAAAGVVLRGAPHSKPPLRWVPVALVAAVTAAAMAHLVGGYLRLAAGYPVGRLYFANSVSAAGPSLLALLLALALLRRSGWLGRSLALFSILILGAYMLGSGVRGLIVVSVPAVVLFLALAPTGRRWRGALTVALVALALLGAESWLQRWDEALRPSLVPGRGTASLFEEDLRGHVDLPPGLTLEAAPWEGGKLRRALGWDGPTTDPLRVPKTLAVSEPGLYRLVADLAGSPAEGTSRGTTEDAEGCVALWWLDEERALLGDLEVCAPPGPAWRQVVATGLAPERTVQARVVLYTKGETPAHWRLKELRLERLGDGTSGRVLEQLAFLSHRLRSALDPLGTGSSAMRGSAAYRLEESRTLWHAFLAASPAAKVFGHGLGAGYSLESTSVKPLSTRLDPDDLHYIHNFYLFLLFKLGIAGSLAILAALALWLGWLWRACRSTPAGGRRALLAALLAAWAGYCVWSVASPEILNFRLAPLWGLTLATAVQDNPRLRPEPPETGA